jgi:hypothetical protein
MGSKFVSFVIEIRPDMSRRTFLLRRDGAAVAIPESYPVRPKLELIWPILEYWLEVQGYALEETGPARTPADIECVERLRRRSIR